MTIFVTTPLGRHVRPGDWQEFHRDAILRVLYDYETSPFDPAGRPLALQSLANVTGLSPSEAQAICVRLEQDGMVSSAAGGFRMTPRGLQEVQATAGELRP